MSAWIPRFCHWCNNAIKRERGGKDSGKYCCKPCYFAAVNAGKQQFKGRLQDAWSCFVDWAYEWDAQRPEWMECEACHKTIQRQSSMQRVCSEACRYRLEKPLHEACDDCGAELNYESRHIKRCEPCRKKRRNEWKKQAGKTPRKRCKKHGVPCDPSVKSRGVFERDGYRCQLCMRKCLRKFTIVNDVPHPLSPTVDHIVAISLGIKGHTWDNVQCACWECNVAKGARAIGQLRLTLA